MSTPRRFLDRLDPVARRGGQTMPEFDSIGFRALGPVVQPKIDWQNRPTFQQVVEFPATAGADPAEEAPPQTLTRQKCTRTF